MKILKSLLIIAMVLLLVPSLYAQGPAGQSKFGIGAYGGFTQPYGDYADPGIGISGGVAGRYYLNNRFNLALGVGFSRLTDVDNEFTSYLNNVDLTANFNLLNSGRFLPYVSLGVGAFSFEFYRESKDPGYVYKQTANFPQGEVYYDGGLIFGGGLDLFLTDKLALTTFADYRFTMSDDLDGVNNQDNNGSKDGYLNAKLGLTYHLGSRTQQGPSDDDLLALERVEFNEVEGDILSQLEDSDDLSMFTETDDQALQQRYDELTQNISVKQNEINNLQQELQFKEQRISDLESDLAGTSGRSATAYSGDGSFSNAYQSALQVYYSRDFASAISQFEQLKAQYPNHKLTSNCDYWIGESYFGLANYEQAIQAFQSVFAHSFSYKKDDATLMLGRCYIQLNDMQNAKNYLQELINNYPDSEYVGKAREWLNRIG